MEHVRRRGKAPPVDTFTGEDADLRFDDWLPALQRAASWNCWSDEEQLIQLAGHFRGRAWQEWNLLDEDDKRTFDVAVTLRRKSRSPSRPSLGDLSARSG